jgi:two-component system sensor histidine kinase PilS (NtrC family)
MKTFTSNLKSRYKPQMPDLHADRSPNQETLDALTWKPLRLLSFYRVILAGLLVVLFFSIPADSGLGLRQHDLYAFTSFAYLAFSVLAGFAARLRQPRYELQAVPQVIVDIIAITVLMFASGGLDSGLGILLLIAVAAGSILLPGRMAYLFAAIAAMAVIGETLYSSLFLYLPGSSGYTQAGLLGLALFATAATTNLLVRRIKDTEALARRRGIDVANLAKLNAHIVQRLQAGIIVTDHEHRVRLINQTAQKMLDLPDVAKGEPLESLSPQLFARLEDWSRHPHTEQAVVPADIGETKVLPHFTMLGTAEGSGSLIFLEDSATLAKQAQQLKLASLGRLTASIAHEIRNPLGAISHATQLLDESVALNDSDQRLITIIGDHTQRVNAVVENILQLSRPGTSTPQQIRIRPWLEKFADEFAHSGNCQMQQISIAVTPADLEVCMDPSLLHQVVWNLCQNAMRHGAQASTPFKLDMACKPSPSSLRPQLDIIDNGAGIDPDIADTIFEPFFTTRSSGTGLGLYIAREICENNQAHLDYIPSPEGGSCFRITFDSSQPQAVSTFV